MDPVSLAGAAATTIVTLLATDAWGTVKEKIGALWRRFRPHEADTVEAELAQAHDEAAVPDAAITRAQALYWESRLLRLLASDDAVAAELARVIDELTAPENGQPAVLRDAARERVGPQHGHPGGRQCAARRAADHSA